MSGRNEEKKPENLKVTGENAQEKAPEVENRKDKLAQQGKGQKLIYTQGGEGVTDEGNN